MSASLILNSDLPLASLAKAFGRTEDDIRAICRGGKPSARQRVSKVVAQAAKVRTAAVKAQANIMDEADAYGALAAEGKTVAEIAKAIGTRPSAVEWRLRLLALTPEVQALVRRGVIKQIAAAGLIELAPERQAAILERFWNREFATPRAMYDACVEVAR